jgi:hypothetical protein
MEVTKPARSYVVAPDGGLYVATPMKLERNRRIVEMYEAGIAKNDIAAQFGITRPRVNQVLKAMARVEKALLARRSDGPHP